jgi:hypothetical protein
MALIQSTAQAGFTTAAPQTSWTAANLTSGSVLWAYLYWNSATVTCTVADPTNGSWTAIGTPQVGAGGLAAFRCQMFVKFGNTSVAKPQVTGTLSGSTADSGICLAEFTAGPTIVVASVYGTSAVANPTQTLTPNHTNEVMAGFAFCATSAHTSAGAGFTIFQSALMNGNPAADNTTVTGGSPTTISWSGGGAQQVIIGSAILGTPASASSPGMFRLF